MRCTALVFGAYFITYKFFNMSINPELLNNVGKRVYVIEDSTIGCALIDSIRVTISLNKGSDMHGKYLPAMVLYKIDNKWYPESEVYFDFDQIREKYEN